MSSGSQQIVHYAPEVTIGTTPAPFVRKVARFTSFTLDGSVSGTDSNEITEKVISSGQYKTSVEFSGELAGELSWATYDDLFEAAFRNSWANNVLSIGTVRKAFSFLRGYKDAGGYHIFNGVHVTGLTITVPEEGLVEVTFTLAGQGRQPVTFTVPAGTITPANTNKIFSNVGVGNVTIDGQSMTDIACVTAFSISFEWTTQSQKCFGKGLSAGKLLMTDLAVTGSVTLAWGDETAGQNELKYTDTPISLSIPLSDEDGNKYTITVPEATISGELPQGARGDLLQYTFEYTVRNQSPTLTRSAAPVKP